LARLVRRQPGTIRAALDSAAWLVGVGVATLARYDFDPSRPHWGGVVGVALVTALAQTLIGLFGGLYRSRWRFGSFDELAALVPTVAVATIVGFSIDLATDPRWVPASATIAGGFVALVLMSGIRYVWRSLRERRMRPDGDSARRVVIFGAGEAGAQIATSMLRDPRSRYLPIAFLDDDRAKRHLRILGVPVVGDRQEIVRVSVERHADVLLIALPSAQGVVVRELTELGVAAALDVKVLPSVGELIDGSLGVQDIRTPTMADLLGRHEIDTDVDSIAGYLTGKTVLVTGAGGSIGSELCRQISRFGPADLVMLDRDESALHAVQLSIEGNGLLMNDSLVLADIRDGNRMLEVFHQHRPDVVFHAAALKHLVLLEKNPEEGYKTNVGGTRNVLDAAIAVGVDRFVNISTDKAADPISVLGHTKLACERMTARVGSRHPGTWLSVRFGNVLGSRGSMLGTFQAQIAAGGPVTVTHPDVTRYFMTIEEAVQLVIQSGAIGKDGETLVLDMGEPVRIDDVARLMIGESGKLVQIQYTGLRPGEKLQEVLFGEGEHGVCREHPMISHVEPPDADAELEAAIKHCERVAPRRRRRPVEPLTA
jgi:FlaA1/EpsC-like NDP-sugar epimerase